MILSFGEALVDMIKVKDAYVPCPGGAPANFAVGLARLGEKVRLMSSVGNDPFGRLILDYVSKNGVDTSLIKRSDKKTTLAFVELTDGIPDFSFYRKADACITKDDIGPGVLSGITHLHCGGFCLSSSPIRDAQIELLKIANEADVRVSFSPNIRPDAWNDEAESYLKRTLEMTDIVIASEDEFGHISKGGSPESLMKGYGIERLVITRGKNGSELHSGSGTMKANAITARSVDTTGAGDSYSSAFVYGLCNGFDDERLLRFASAAASCTISKIGAMSALPTMEDVNEMLARGL